MWEERYRGWDGVGVGGRVERGAGNGREGCDRVGWEER